MVVTTVEPSPARTRALVFLLAAYEGVDTPLGKGLPHAQAVGDVLRDDGYDVPVQVAGLLHDVVEDTACTVEDVREQFGDAVATLVAQLTEDDGVRDYERRKKALREQLRRAGSPALDIALADKIATMHHAVLTGTRVRRRKLGHYRATLEISVGAAVNPALCRRVEVLLDEVTAGAS